MPSSPELLVVTVHHQREIGTELLRTSFNSNLYENARIVEESDRPWEDIVEAGNSAMGKDIRTIQKGYLVDSAINKSLMGKEGVKVIQSCESKSMNSTGTLVQRIQSYREDNEHVFVVLHFESPQHFACLHVSPSKTVY